MQVQRTEIQYGTCLVWTVISITFLRSRRRLILWKLDSPKGPSTIIWWCSLFVFCSVVSIFQAAIPSRKSNDPNLRGVMTAWRHRRRFKHAASCTVPSVFRETWRMRGTATCASVFTRILQCVFFIMVAKNSEWKKKTKWRLYDMWSREGNVYEQHLR